MATIGNSFLNLIDLYKGMEDGRDIGDVVELLHAVNPVLWDAIAVECNLGTIHRTRIRTGLPTVTWGRLYQGIPVQVDVPAGRRFDRLLAEARRPSTSAFCAWRRTPPPSASWRARVSSKRCRRRSPRASSTTTPRRPRRSSRSRRPLQQADRRSLPPSRSSTAARSTLTTRP